MKHIKRLICAILSVVLLVPCISVFSETDTDTQSTPAGDLPVLAENENYTLMLDEDKKAVAVYEKNSGNVFNSIVTDSIYDLSTCSDLFIEYMQSMVVAHYAMHTDTNGTVIDAYSGSKTTETKIKKVKNGADFTYTFTQPKISLCLEVRLDKDGITFNIPFDSVKEKGKYSLLSVEIAPFFGAAAYDDEGYIFYPENTGALTYFDKVSSKSKSSTELTLDIYGDSNMETVMEQDKASVATMPVFGINRGNSAVFAVAQSGECDAKIHIRPAVTTSSMRLHTAGFDFTYHYQYTVYLSNIVRNGKNSTGNVNGSKVDKNIIKGDRTVKYFLLSGENSDYSAMANVYRDYLTDNKLIKNSSDKGYNELALTLLGGIKTQGELFGNNFVEMTSYSQMRDILEDYRSFGIDNIYLNIKGWSRSGYKSYPQSYSPVNALGGSGGLKKLSKYLKENKINSTLQCGVVYTTRSLFGLKGKAAQKGTGIPVADEEQTVYLLHPESALSRVKQSVFKKYSFGGAFDEIGNMLYGSYKSQNRVTREKTVKYWQKLMSSCDYTAVQGCNAYAFAYSDRLYGIETQGDKRLICDDNIPFLSMVLYGSIALNGTSGNCSGDYDTAVLRWLEYGCSPCYELSQNSPRLLRDTEYNTLFFSKNESMEEKVKATCADFSERLGVLSGTYMIKHEKPSENLVRITFENGYRLLINYGNEPAELDGQTVQGVSYTVYKQGGKAE